MKPESMGSGKGSMIIVVCIPEERYQKGRPVPVRVELINKTGCAIKILAAGVPWIYHHAISFSVIEGGQFENRLWVLEPPSAPDITIEKGATAAGEVDLAQYLYSKDDRSINQIPGIYRIYARVVTFVSMGQENYERLELYSESLTIIINN